VSKRTDRFGPVTAEMAREWAERTRAEQGLPLHVTDPGVIHRVLTVLGRTQVMNAVNPTREPGASARARHGKRPRD
jgi:hypothetical protein